MSKLNTAQVGVNGVRRTLAYSKRDLLLFEQLYIMELPRQLRNTTELSLAADIEYLVDAGVVVGAPSGPWGLFRHSIGWLRSAISLDDEMNEEQAIAELVSRGLIPVTVPSLADLEVFLDDFADDHPPRTSMEGHEYLIAAALSLDSQTRAVPIFESRVHVPEEHLSALSALEELRLRMSPTAIDTSAVAEVILRNLPVPVDDIPLESILEFRADSETRRHLDRLNVWMRRSAYSGAEVRELYLEVEEGLHDFRAHMRLANMRHRNSDLRMLVTLPFAIVEEVIRLRPRGALEAWFDYRDRKANRLEVELSAPGGVFAYLHEAETRFGG